jgi:pimeloyl-ACP methyl ester carboxylesterase
MAYLSQFYRTYALDFWGFGESGTNQDIYEVKDFVKMVDQFTEKLGIYNAPLVGHSMGGTVSLSVAIQYPKLAQKVVVIGSPIDGSSLSFLLKWFGNRIIASIVYTNLWAFRLTMRVLAPLYTRDRRWPSMMDRDLSKISLESFLLSIASLRKTDLRPHLNRITIPVMGMYGDKDIVVNPNQWQALSQGVPKARIERKSSVGHFIMLDDPLWFRSTLRNFLDSEEPQA